MSIEVLEKLFGAGYELKKMRQLSQPSDFACEEVVIVKSGSHILENVRIVGPLREQTQVEISVTDAKVLGVTPLIRLSGDLVGTTPVVLEGPKGAVSLNEGLIVALRHLHCNEAEAAKLGVKNGDKIAVLVEGERAIVFENVSVRVGHKYKLCLHLDTDEGNAAGINKKGFGVISLRK